MTYPEMARIEYRKHGPSRMFCPCGGDTLYWMADHTGARMLDGPCARCVHCGRVLSADGVVISGAGDRKSA